MAETVHPAALRRGRLTRFRKSLAPFSLAALKARRRLGKERQAADEQLLQSEWISPLLQWRVNELVGRRNRTSLARSLRHAVASADGHYLPSASPLNRGAVRAESPRLLALAKRLEDGDSVAPQGVLLVERLLVDGFSPLYAREQAESLSTYLDVARAALEPHRW